MTELKPRIHDESNGLDYVLEIGRASCRERVYTIV